MTTNPQSPEAVPDPATNANQLELLSWRDVSLAIDQLIAKANRRIDLFDHDLSLQGWETRDRHDALRSAMHYRNVTVRILLRDIQTLRTNCPRLISLLTTHGHRLAILRVNPMHRGEQFFAVADGQHLIYRPNLVQSHGVVFSENRSKTSTWAKQFEVLWQHGGEKVFPEAFGL
jgi:phosphatidylserine/phosphatidylglycerophosphate/cardiolipin synthase-like enzyme